MGLGGIKYSTEFHAFSIASPIGVYLIFRAIVEVARRAPPCPREGLSLPIGKTSTTRDESSFCPIRGRRAMT